MTCPWCWTARSVTPNWKPLAFKTEKKLLRSLNLFDVYEGDKIEAGKKSYAISFLLQDDTQTLTDQQIDKGYGRLMSSFEGSWGQIMGGA